MKRLIWTATVVAVSAAAALAAEEGLLLHYPFDEAGGAVIEDASGNGNDGKVMGGVVWVKGDYGTAVGLNGQDGFIECPAVKGFDPAAGGTIMAWCCLKSMQGGLVTWSKDTGWEGQRLELAFNTFSAAATTPLFVLADGKSYKMWGEFGDLKPDVWTHLAVRFDGKIVTMYKDGRNVCSDIQSVKPAIDGLPLWVGKCQGLGQGFAHGLLDEVRVYSRVLSAEEVKAAYDREVLGRK